MSISRFPCNPPVNPDITKPLEEVQPKVLGAAVLVLKHVWMFQSQANCGTQTRRLPLLLHPHQNKIVTHSHSKHLFTFSSNLLQ